MDSRPGSCNAMTNDLLFRIEIRRLKGRTLLFVVRFVMNRHAMDMNTKATIVSFVVSLGKKCFFGWQSYQDRVYETAEDAAGRSEHEIR
jgi:hypothetical protein